MKDTWWNHNTDKVLLFVLVLLGGFMVMHIVHHDPSNMEAMTWAEGAFSTTLGALILILTGRVQRSDGQTANGLPPTAVTPMPSPLSTPAPPTNTGVTGSLGTK